MFFLLGKTSNRGRTTSILSTFPYSYSCSLYSMWMGGNSYACSKLAIARWLKPFTRKQHCKPERLYFLLCISTKKMKNSSCKDYYESRRCLQRCLCPVPCDDFCARCRVFLFALRVFKSSAQDMKPFTVSLFGTQEGLRQKTKRPKDQKNHEKRHIRPK